MSCKIRIRYGFLQFHFKYAIFIFGFKVSACFAYIQSIIFTFKFILTRIIVKRKSFRAIELFNIIDLFY